MTVAPADGLLAVLAGFVVLAVFWIGFVAQMLVRLALGGESRAE